MGIAKLPPQSCTDLYPSHCQQQLPEKNSSIPRTVPRGQGSSRVGAEQLSPAFVSFQVVHLRRPLRRRPSSTSLACISSQHLATPVTVCGAPSTRPAPKLSCTSAFIWHWPACRRLPCPLTPKEMHFIPVSAMGQIKKPQPGSRSGALSTRSLSRALVKYQRCPRDTPNIQPAWNWPMESGPAWRRKHKLPRNVGTRWNSPVGKGTASRISAMSFWPGS